MKRIALLLALALTAALVPAALVADGEKTMTGQYHWTNANERGSLEAVFTPTGEDTWDVSFFFKFNDQDHTYSGTATGSLTDGSLAGTVQNENKRRTFTFTGTTRSGSFTGRHAETTGGGERRTGTLTLGG